LTFTLDHAGEEKSKLNPTLDPEIEAGYTAK
jgi:hypothetical protein